MGGVKEVDIDHGMEQVVVDGFKFLCFETTVEFNSGEDIPVSLHYERLFLFCRRCHSLCHDLTNCPQGNSGEAISILPHEPEDDSTMLSYKGVVSRRKSGNSEVVNRAHNGILKGKRYFYEIRDETDH